MSLKSKVAIITGSGSGIGAATALLFAKEGANIVIVDINEENAKNIGNQCEEFGIKALVITADITNDTKANEVINTTVDTFGKIHMLINCAGIVREESIADGRVMETYDEVMNTNLRSIVVLTSLATPYLKESKGCIINVSSAFSLAPRLAPLYVSYCISKAGVDLFTQMCASALAPSVRVNAVAPGPVATNILKHAGLRSSFDEVAKQIALGRCSEPEEVADLIMFLVSDKAKSITGSCYSIDNGMSIK